MLHNGFYCGLALMALLSGCAAHEPSGLRDASPHGLTPWAELSVRPSLARRISDTTIHVGDLRLVGSGEQREHWLRKTTTFFGGETRAQWTDTRSCAGARAVLTNMYALEMPRPAEGGLIEVRADGVRYTLSTDAEYGSGRLARLSVSAPGGTPLADWAEQSLLELEACWSDLPPAALRRVPTAGRR